MGQGLPSLAAALLLLVGFGASAASAAPPPNDDFVNAISVTSLPFSDAQDTTDATREPDDPNCSGGQEHTVWYAFTPATDLRVTANTFGSEYDTTLGVYTGGPGSLTEIACNDQAARSNQSRVVFEATAGTTYFVMIASWYVEPGGNLVFAMDEAPPPVNDNFEDAIVATLPFSDTRSTLGATSAAEDPTDCYDDAAPTVWYAFTATKDLRIVAHAFDSDYDTTIAVYTGAPGSFTQVACNSIFQVIFDAVTGETYYFMVKPAFGELGSLTLSIREAPPALDFKVTINRFGSFDPKTGEAVIRGTAICNQMVWVELWSSLSQTVGRLLTINGNSVQGFECDGTMPWKAALAPYSGRFAGGPATADIQAVAYSEFEQFWTGANAKITLRGGKRQPGGKPGKPKK
ncbi:MAG TPA: hypothetical protein VFG43_03995 [Geminicoccaceae bacterium]|nr:hypothetical protein [Geminicoccaceae bacterium]